MLPQLLTHRAPSLCVHLIPENQDSGVDLEPEEICEKLRPPRGVALEEHHRRGLDITSTNLNKLKVHLQQTLKGTGPPSCSLVLHGGCPPPASDNHIMNPWPDHWFDLKS